MNTESIDVTLQGGVEWIGAGGFYTGDPKDPTFKDLFRWSVQQAHLIAVDPGDPCGVATFGYDLASVGVGLFEVDPTLLAHTLVRCFPSGCELDLVCEAPLFGAVRVYDEWPQKVSGFLELWHHAEHAEEGGRYISAPVSWLKPARHFVDVTSSGVSRHAKDALRYGVLATQVHKDVRTRLIEAT